MKVEFGDVRLERMAYDPKFFWKYDVAVSKAFLKKLGRIMVAEDERDLYGIKSFRYEKLKGDREGQRSIRLNDQWRLILELRQEAGEPVVRIVEIVDYH